MVETAVSHKPKKTHIVFNSGGGGHHESLRTPNVALKEAFGDRNATVVPSIILGDTPSPKRFPMMGADYREAISNGPTVILAHSLGGAEALEGLTHVGQDFFADEENRRNTIPVFISPTGDWKTPLGGIKYLIEYGKVLIQESAILGRTLPGKTSILHGIVSFATLPPTNIQREDLIEGVRKVAPKVSHYDSTVTQVDAVPDKNYSLFLDDNKIAEIQATDAKFAGLLQHDTLTARQRREGRRLVRQRGRQAAKIIKEAFANDHADDFGDPEIPHEVYNKKDARALRRSFLTGTFLTGKVRQRFLALKEAGIEPYLAEPDGDSMMSHRRYVRLLKKVYGDNYKDHLIQIPLATHNAPYATQPQILVELAKHVIKRSEKASKLNSSAGEKSGGIKS